MTKQQLEHIPGINKTLTFGKIKGKTILEAIEDNPGYIVWCIRNVQGFNIDPVLSRELCRQHDEHFRKYGLAQANGYSVDEVRRLMKKHNMHATEAMDFLEYDVPEHY